MHRAQAIRAGVPAADDHDVLAGGAHERLVGNHVSFTAAILLRQVVDREVNAGELASGDRQIARPFRAAAEHDRIELAPERRHRQIGADVHAGTEHDAFLFEDGETTVDQPLLDLELGDAVTQQSADPVRFLEHGHQMTGLVELVGRRQPSRARTDDRDPLAAPHRGGAA